MRKLVLACLLVLASCGNPAFAEVRITDDIGGQIGTYLVKFEAVRDSGERVVIDGRCLSACTLVLGIVPADRICVTPKAMLGFHAAWMPDPEGRPVPSKVGTQALWELYPTRIHRWLNRRGGLTPKMVYLAGEELRSMFRDCKDESYALAPLPERYVPLQYFHRPQ